MSSGWTKAIRVLRLNGQPLIAEVSDLDFEKLQQIFQLKELLVRADSLARSDSENHFPEPPPALVELLPQAHTSSTRVVQLQNGADIPWDSLWADSELPPLTYVVRDAQRSDLESMLSRFIPGLCFPAEQFADNIYLGFANYLNSVKGEHIFRLICFGDSSKAVDVWRMWKYGILRLPAQLANEVRADGSTVITDMVLLRRNWDLGNGDSIIEETILDFLRRSDLQPPMVNSVAPSKFETFLMPALFMCLRQKKPYRNARSLGEASMTVASQLLSRATPEVLDYRIGQTQWGRSVWDRSNLNGDTMLHHILEPVSWGHSTDKSDAEAEFCIVLAKKLSLRQLCHRNVDGICALSYAETFAGTRGVGHVWANVRDVIKSQTLSRCRQDGLHLQEIIHTMQDLAEAKKSALDYPFEELGISHLEDVLAELPNLVWYSAQIIRLQWLEAGWTFTDQKQDRQIYEVIRHFKRRGWHYH